MHMNIMFYIVIAAMLGFVPQLAEVTAMLTGQNPVMLALLYLGISGLILSAVRRRECQA